MVSKFFFIIFVPRLFSVHSLPNADFGAKQLGRSDGHHLGAGGWAFQKHSVVILDVVDLDGLADKDQGLRIGKRPTFISQACPSRTVT